MKRITFRQDKTVYVVNHQHATIVMFIHENRSVQHLQLKKFIFRNNLNFTFFDELQRRGVILIKNHVYSLSPEGIAIVNQIQALEKEMA